jgi:TIR domain-containing protein
MQKGVNIFCCYAHKDQSLLSELKAHLFSLQHSGLITIWSDTNIAPGTNWEEQVKAHLNAAHIVLLLISPAFMASDYCYSQEMQRAMERYERGKVRMIPIILRPVDWHNSPFGKLQALPLDAKPIVRWTDRDEALFDVARGIRQVAEALKLIRNHSRRWELQSL